MAKWGWKIPTFWVLGSICLLVGSMTATTIQNYDGMDAVIRALVSLMAFLIGGMCWISVSIAVKNKL